MNTNTQTIQSLRNGLLWLTVILLTVAGIIGNMYYQNESFLARAAALVVLTAVVFGIWLQTTMGKRFLVLYQGARIELRKVVWPTRQETMQSSLVVLVVVAVLALALWLFDSIFSWLISLLVGI